MVEVKYFSTNGEIEKLTCGASGFDLKAKGYYNIVSKDRLLVSTGLYLEIPEGYEGQVRPRSGLAINRGIGVLNSPGTIDSDYRGEIKVIVINLGSERIVINPGDRIAQLVIQEIPKINLTRVTALTELSSSERGANGFGSTGK